MRDTYNGKRPKRRKKAKRAGRKLNTIAGGLLLELERRLSEEALSEHQEKLALYQKVLAQKRTDKDKVYSLHKPFTCCIAKGKAHKQYEFGNKVGLIATGKELIITAIKSFQGNPHDGKTIEPLLKQMHSKPGHTPKELVYDRGGKGRKQIGDTIISTPDHRPLKRDTPYQRRKKRKQFRRRAAIGPVIGHLKTDFEMGQNYPHGKESPQINAFLAATGWNLKKMMQKLKTDLEKSIWAIIKMLFQPNKQPQITNC